LSSTVVARISGFCRPDFCLDDGRLDALGLDLLEELRVRQGGCPEATPRSNCLNTVNSTSAITSHTATLENH
jgi:hypothetical protein